MFRTIALGDVGSTNTEALERLFRGEAPPFWLTAERQLSGRGRLGRAWVSERGNLYATLALRDPAPPDRLSSLSLVAAVAARRAVVATTGNGQTRLKWPNDLILDGAKVAGILLEAHVVDAVRYVLIGCGINCSSHPEQAAYPTTDLRSAGYPVEPDRLFASLNETMSTALAAWDRGERTQPFLDEWTAHAHRMGETVTVSSADRRVAGRLLGLDEMGRLLLETDGGCVTIAAGDLEAPRAE